MNHTELKKEKFQSYRVEMFSEAFSHVLFGLSLILDGDDELDMYDRINTIIGDLHEMTISFEQVYTAGLNLDRRLKKSLTTTQEAEEKE